MNSRAKTIQIFLPHGDPRGVRVAELTTRIVQVIEVPRSQLNQFSAMDESRQVGVYFLFGASDDSQQPRVYIGQTGDLRGRLSAHNKEKDFWERALVMVSRTNSLTQTHALFLEWHCLQMATKARRYTCENGNAGSRPHTLAPMEADCHEIFETGQVLLATLGYPLFDSVVTAESKRQETVFHLTAVGAKGRGLYTAEGFVVLEGSEGRAQNVPSLVGTSDERFRQRLIDSGAMAVRGDRVVFLKDHVFRSPSMAAIALLGRTSNGWMDWKTAEGRTLDEVKRS